MQTYYSMIYVERDSICYSNLIQVLYYAFDNVYGNVTVLFIDPIIDVKRSMSHPLNNSIQSVSLMQRFTRFT